MRCLHLASCALALVLLVPGCSASPPTDDTGPGADAGAPDADRHDAAARSCFVDEDCDDGFYCNGTETCVMGYCQRVARVCDDHVACTSDLCNETTHACVSHAPDTDGDGFGAASCVDGVGVPLGNDCDDTNALVYPGNPEICDHVDQDCDPSTLGGADMDHDGTVPTACCNPQHDGTSLCGRDCNDMNPSISFVATEICDTIDNDCDTMIDESVLMMSWPDLDLDGYGDASATPDVVCTVPSSRANQGGDCNDHALTVHPTATETCNGVDDDCDTMIDEGASATCGVTGSTMECIRGACAVVGCDATHFDCNGTASDGCESSLCDAASSCGICGGVTCGFGCDMGQCVLTADLLVNLTGIVHDATTHAGIGGATITTVDVCPASTTTTNPDGTYSLQVRDHYRPRWIRIEAPGHPPHVQPVGGDAYLFTSAIVDAWRADRDAATPASASRAILVIEGVPVITDVTHRTPNVGPGNGYSAGDLLPTIGGDGTVFLGAQPGRQPLGGTISTGSGCSSVCTPTYDLWLEGGAVTHVVADFMCLGVC